MRADILIVDDDEFICDSLRTALQTKAYDVCLDHDGAAALDICQTTSIDLVFLDLKLPDGYGLYMMERIKEAATQAACFMADGQHWLCVTVIPDKAA